MLATVHGRFGHCRRKYKYNGLVQVFPRQASPNLSRKKRTGLPKWRRLACYRRQASCPMAATGSQRRDRATPAVLLVLPCGDICRHGPVDSCARQFVVAVAQDALRQLCELVAGGQKGIARADVGTRTRCKAVAPFQLQPTDERTARLLLVSITAGTLAPRLFYYATHCT